jgi:hypothetical protein
LQGLKENLPSTDPAIPRLLQDAPVLPLQAVTSFLQELIAAGSEWAGVSLSAAYGLFESRPAARQALLLLVLHAAVSADSLAREKAVGLIVSKLMGWEAHAAAVLEFATQHLLLLLQPLPAAAVDGAGQQQKQEVDASSTAVADQQQQGVAAGSGDAPAAAAAAEGAGEGAEAQQQQQQVMDADAAAQHSMLYLSLCTIKPQLLQLLLETYGKAGEHMCWRHRRSVLSYVCSVVSVLPACSCPCIANSCRRMQGRVCMQLLLAALVLKTCCRGILYLNPTQPYMLHPDSGSRRWLYIGSML